MREATYTGTAAFPSDTCLLRQTAWTEMYIERGGNTYMDIPHTIMEVCSLKEH